jgi:hypothetical protein
MLLIFRNFTLAHKFTINTTIKFTLVFMRISMTAACATNNMNNLIFPKETLTWGLRIFFFFIIWSPMTLNKRRLCTGRSRATVVILFGLGPEEFPGPSCLLTSVFPSHCRLLALTTINTILFSLRCGPQENTSLLKSRHPHSVALTQTSQKIFLS